MGPRILCIALVLGCEGSPSIADGGTDAGLTIAAPMAPADPNIAWESCPAGWTAMAEAGCDPWPDEAACAPNEVRVPGRGCEALGTACEGTFAPDLPSTGVVYVELGAIDGDGTRARPFGAIAEALPGIASGTIVALSSGTFETSFALPGGVSVRGACVDGTILHAPIGGITEGAIAARGGSISNLTITGDRPGVIVFAGVVELHDVKIDGVVNAGVLVIGGEARADGLIVRGTRSDLTRGVAGRGIDVEPGGRAELSRALIDSSHEFGVFAAGEIVLTDSVVSGTLSQTDGTHGRGVNVIGGVHAALERCVVERSREAGILVTEESTVDLTDVVVDGVEAIDDDGSGVALEMGATGTLARVRIEHAVGAGFSISSSAATARELVVRDIAPEIRKGDRGFGVDVFRDSTVSIERALIERTRAAGVGTDLRGSVVLTDAIVRDVDVRELAGDMGAGVIALGADFELHRVRIERTAGEAVSLAEEAVGRIEDLRTIATGAGDRSGPGFLVYLGASLEADRVAIEDASDVAIQIGNPGTHVAIRDLTITRGRAAVVDDPEFPTYAGGIQVESGGVLELTRALLDGTLERAIGVWMPGSQMRAVDLEVRDTRESPAGERGRGAVVSDGALLTIQRGRFLRNHEVALLAVLRGSLVLADVEVMDTESESIDGTLGRGLTVQSGAVVDLTRVLMRGNREVGLIAGDEGSIVRGASLEITGTRERACAESTCGGAGAGTGISAHGGARLELVDFTLAENALCGLQLANGATVALSGGTIRDNPIGANVQDAAFDFDSLDGVEFQGNERNVDATLLPLPETGLSDR